MENTTACSADRVSRSNILYILTTQCKYLDKPTIRSSRVNEAEVVESCARCEQIQTTHRHNTFRFISCCDESLLICELVMFCLHWWLRCTFSFYTQLTKAAKEIRNKRARTVQNKDGALPLQYVELLKNNLTYCCASLISVTDKNQYVQNKTSNDRIFF